MEPGYLSPQGIRALLDAPVRIFGRQVGVLCSESAGERVWEMPDRNFAAALATLVGLALEHNELLRTREQLRASASFDLDTGLPTALYLEQVLSLAASRADTRLPGSWLLRFELQQQTSLQASLSAGALRELYRQLSSRLRARLPGVLECAHLSEGEFVLWLADVHAGPEALLAALEACLEPALDLEGQSLLLAPRCGLRRIGDPEHEAAPALCWIRRPRWPRRAAVASVWRCTVRPWRRISSRRWTWNNGYDMPPGSNNSPCGCSRWSSCPVAG